ncbi:hypothetical protein JHK82_012601 [Glycine max]|nr:hypothetical protein JHK85_012952 [Glycine max]KAG5057620.1 hypothetical protein JHK86_012616 [Glycine max]KAG5154632.1 hypothetical protein JHK82_012601 [Glycine max]
MKEGGCWWTSAGAIAEEEPAAVIGGVALVLVDVEGATVVAPEAPGLEDNLQVEQEQPLGESGSGSNIDLVGGNLTDPTLDAFDIDNLVLNDNVKDHFSIEKELEDDGDADDGGGGDIGDDFIRGLMNI